MLLAGSDDGVYRLAGVGDPGETTVDQVLASGRVMRLRSVDGIAGVFAATTTGLYHTTDLDEWRTLDVPREQVYGVGAIAGDAHAADADAADADAAGTDAADGRLYAGTRPAHVYAADLPATEGPIRDLDWLELDDVQRLPSRDEWRLPRHEDLAQVRDVHVHPDAPDRVALGVEVGGVHVSEDRGDTWTERREGMHDDVHELHLAGPETYIAATGFGLFRSTDAGRTWTRLDEGFDQRYFRSAFTHDGRLYAGGALSNSSTWDDPDADPQFFVADDGETLDPVDLPRPDETVTGLATLHGQVVAATHRGSVLRQDGDDWSVAGSFPTPGDVTGTYTPLCRWDD